MPRTHRSIAIALHIVFISTTSPAAFSRSPKVVEELASLVHRVLDYVSTLKTVSDVANAITDRAADECRDTPIPGMNDQ